MPEFDKMERYIGDGVYASFDGYHINLAVNHHLNHVVALDPYVVEALFRYVKDIKERPTSAEEVHPS